MQKENIELKTIEEKLQSLTENFPNSSLINSNVSPQHITDILESIPTKKIIKTCIPIGIYLQEAENLAQWCLTDIVPLSKLGVDREKLEDLQLRTKILRQTQTQWVQDKNSIPEDKKPWETIEKQLWTLQDELLFAFRFAFRDHPELRDKVKWNPKRKNQRFIIQDLRDLAEIGNENLGLLSAINFKPELLEEAILLSQKSAVMLANYHMSHKKSTDSKLLRDKAYTYLKNLVDEIRNAGKYLFRDNPERLKGYKSEFWQGQNRNRRNKKI
ncbi:hypothetical protein [Ancylomarina longa]|uniref:Uncharacterized protein n=1 Tax=Ancylomarina longa TaxID=2487017 RepID=A0A434AZ09_9BACT|nr:hypothetical protein [Ancylomarina longa]RUT79859.1 hypothetical protein DLK05_00445 [Ancylomarina longa]